MKYSDISNSEQSTNFCLIQLKNLFGQFLSEETNLFVDIITFVH